MTRTPNAEQRRSRQRKRSVPTGWRLVVIVGGLTICGPLCIDMNLPAFPAIGRDLDSSASQVQLTMSACLVGISAGQLVLGPLSDRSGRRAPLLAGLALFVASSIACAFAPTIYALMVFRFIQGFAGAAGMVLSRAIARDLLSGVALVRFFSTLLLMTGIGPIVAPPIGGWVLASTAWEGVFVALAIMGSALLAVAWWQVPETLELDKRSSGSIGSSLTGLVRTCRDTRFVGYTLICGIGGGGVLAYIAASPFILQTVFGISPELYGVLFALNAGALIVGSQINARGVGRIHPDRMLVGGLWLMVLASTAFAVVVELDFIGAAGVIGSALLAMFAWGFVAPNSVGLGMHRHPEAAGSAAAVLGSFQFLAGAALVPLTGLGGASDPRPTAYLMVTVSVVALLVRIVVCPNDGTAMTEGVPEDAETTGA